MKTTNQKEIKLKDGTIIPAGAACEITFNQSVMSIVTVNGRAINIRCSSLPKYFNRFKIPSLRVLERANDEGICRSMLGEKTEPDGYDSQGSPSWMLVLGVI